MIRRRCEQFVFLGLKNETWATQDVIEMRAMR